MYEEAQALSREVRDDLMIALTLLNLGDLMRRQGDTEQATALFRESLVLLRRQGEVAGDARLFAGIEAAEALEGFARVMISTGQAEAATRLLGAADTLRERMHALVPATQRADYDRSVAAAREALEPPVFGTAWTAGRAMSSEQAIAYALEPEPLTTGRPAAEATLRVHKRGWRR